MKEVYFNSFDIQEGYSNSLVNEYETIDRSLEETSYIIKGRMWGSTVKNIVPSIIIWAKINCIPLTDFEIVEAMMQNARTSSNSFFFILLNKKEYVKLLLDMFDNKKNDDFNKQLFKKLPKHSVQTTSFYWKGPLEYNNKVTQDYIDVYIWVRDNCRGNVYKEDNMWFFEEETDATAFKLYWMDDKK